MQWLIEELSCLQLVLLHFFQNLVALYQSPQTICFLASDPAVTKMHLKIKPFIFSSPTLLLCADISLPFTCSWFYSRSQASFPILCFQMQQKQLPEGARGQLMTIKHYIRNTGNSPNAVHFCSGGTLRFLWQMISIHQDKKNSIQLKKSESRCMWQTCNE